MLLPFGHGLLGKIDKPLARLQTLDGPLRVMDTR